MTLEIDQMIDSVEKVSTSEHDVARINSIKKKYPQKRQDSKMPTFALTYQGTYVTLMANGGFAEALARQIEHRYHGLYVVSDQWIAAKLNEASKRGYLEVAFGLKVRTPKLKQVVLNTRKTPWEAQAEGRTAGNALGQSWGLLNTRASIEFLEKVRAHPDYRDKIRPCAHIHDAQYFMVPDDVELLEWMNHHLVKAVEWQDHPDIYHPEVPLGGELSVFYPSWKYEKEIPNGASQEEIQDLLVDHLTELEQEGVAA